jgi:hypothetical protein
MIKQETFLEDVIEGEQQVYVIPYADKLRICVNNKTVWKPMTIDAYMHFIVGCIDSIQEMRRLNKCKCGKN